MISNYTIKNRKLQSLNPYWGLKTLKGISVVLLIFFFTMNVQSQTTFTSIKSGNYSDPGTWGTIAGPTSIDNIVISSGNKVTLDGDFTANDVIITGEIESSATAFEYIITGNLTVNSTGLFTGYYYFDAGSYGYNIGMKLTVAGDIINNGRIALNIDSSVLKLNGANYQTVSGIGSFGGTITATDNTNTRSVVNELVVDNSSIDTPNVIWDFNNVKIRSKLTLTNGRIDLGTNKMSIGNYAGANINIAKGNGFLSGTIGRWYSAYDPYEPLIPGIDYNNSRTSFPFIDGNGKNRAAYITRPLDPNYSAVDGEISVSYLDANAVDTGFSINDNGYDVTNVYQASWIVSKGDTYSFPIGNESIAFNLEDAYVIKNGNSRIIKSDGTVLGTFQEGTTTPFAQRIGLIDADLNNTFQVGYNAATDTPVTTLASGNWNDAAIWSTNAVPSCSEVVTILSGNTVTVNSDTSVQGVNIVPGGTLINESSTLTVGCTNNNAVFTNNGTYTINGGSLIVNGSISHGNGSFFNQNGGNIIVDGNNNGDVATSSNLTLFRIGSSTLNLSGGKITIVDPPVVNSTLVTTHTATEIVPCTGFFCWYGSNIFLDSVDGIAVGQVVVGAGVPAGTTVANINFDGSINTQPSLPATGLTLPLSLSFYNVGGSVSAFVYSSEKNYAAGTGHTLQIGDGISNEKSAVTINGYNCNFKFANGTLSLNNLIVDALDSTNRFVNLDNTSVDGNLVVMNVQNDFTIMQGKVKGQGVNTYYGGNVINNGELFVDNTTYFGNYLEGAFVATSKPQTISGTGTFNAQVDLSLNTDESTGSVKQLQVNNTSPEGVTFLVPFSIVNSLNMTAGIIHTSETSLLNVGAPDMGFNGSINGNFGNTCYIDGPVSKVIGGGQLATNLTSDYNSQFLFPVGNGSYSPIWVGVTTPSGGFGTAGTNLKVQAFDTNPGTASSNIAYLSQNRWAVSKTDGTIINFNIQVGNSEIAENNIIVEAPSADGVYDNNFGITATFTEGTPNTLTSDTEPIPFSNFEGYFATARQSECSVITPGNTLATETTICNGKPVTLSLENVVIGEGITYQWQYSTTDSDYMDIMDATNTTATVSPVENTYYRCNVSCSFSSSTVASTPVMVSLNNTITETTPGKICDAETTATIYATSTEDIKWYDAQVGGNVVGTGSSYTTPEITETTTYYAGTETTSSATAGLTLSGYPSGGGGLNKGLVFNLNNSIILNSVKVYPVQTPGGAGPLPITIAVFQNGVQVPGTTAVVFTPVAFEDWSPSSTTSQTVTLDFTLPAGDNYSLQVTNGISYNNALATTSPYPVPYPITNGAVTITATIDNDYVEAYGYNYFYDWELTEVCSSARVPVEVTYQTECDLSTVSNPKILEKIVAYPNPYTNTFKIDLATISTSDVTVKVYDMVGRLLDKNEISLSKIPALEVGARYPSGVFNVVVTQDGISKTLRVIKR